jgi:hypothetical protein
VTHETRTTPTRYDEKRRWRFEADCERCEERAHAEGPYHWAAASRRRWWEQHGEHEPVALRLFALRLPLSQEGDS